MIKLVIIGCPNVSKSMLFNRLCTMSAFLMDFGMWYSVDLALVYNTITWAFIGFRPRKRRDSVEVPWTFCGRPVMVENSTGMRRNSKHDHDDQIKRLSVRNAFRSIDSAEVVVFIVDISEPKLIHMDPTIAQRIFEEGPALVLAFLQLQPCRRCLQVIRCIVSRTSCRNRLHKCAVFLWYPCTRS